MIRKQLGPMEIVGFSLAGEETVLAAPQYNVCFDPGRAPREIISIDNLCVTHGHMDHAAGIAYYLSQRGFLGAEPGRIIIHRDLAPAIERLMAVWADIEGHPSPGRVEGVAPLQDVPIRRNLAVRPFAVNHDQGALGYSLIETRHRLKPEYLGLTGPELVALKKRGIEIEARHEVSMLTCSGDTALGDWLHHAFVRRTQALLMECTFFDPDHVRRARAGKHIHVKDLPAILEAVPEARIMLTHLSRRTDLRQARSILERFARGPDLERLSFLMERPPRFRKTGAGRDSQSAAEPC